jgi:hypothetical protein
MLTIISNEKNKKMIQSGGLEKEIIIKIIVSTIAVNEEIKANTQKTAAPFESNFFRCNKAKKFFHRNYFKT